MANSLKLGLVKKLPARVSVTKHNTLANASFKFIPCEKNMAKGWGV